MRVAWLSHQFPADKDLPKRDGLLPGRFAGGAEMSTEEMIAAAPAGVEVVKVRLPADLPDLSGFDRLVVGATEHLRPAQAEQLAPYRPLYWVRSPQQSWLLPWFRKARLLIWASHEAAKDHKWCDVPYEVCPAPLNPDEIPTAPKEDFTLWAGRDIGHKGRDEARRLASENGWQLVELTDVPRPVVLEHMARAVRFVHTPVGFVDPCPRTVIEAEIAGCEIVVNDRVGRVPVRGAEAVAEYIRGVPGRFWGWVRDS